MKHLLWIVPLILISVLIPFYAVNWGRVLPRTSLMSGYSVSGLTKSELIDRLDTLLHSDNVTVAINEDTYGTSFAKLGVGIDFKQVSNELFSRTSMGEIIRLTKGMRSIVSSSSYPLPLVVKKNVNYFPQQIGKESRLSYNINDGSFRYIPPRLDYEVSNEGIQEQVDKELGQQEPRIIATGATVSHREPTLSDLNQRLNKTSAEGLILRVKDGTDYSDIPLTSSEIRNMLAFSLRGDEPILDMDKDAFSTTVMSKLSTTQKKDFQLASAYPNALKVLSERFMLNNIDPVVLGIDDGPSSHGEKANSYLEIDKSQQKMYVFQDGNLKKSYRVSTGYDYPTPIGEFHILNKAPKAFSDIYHVWMDYWMGFKYANDIGAYLGIHELAYSLNDKKQRLYRLGNYIGEPKTGGCIALSPGDAREVYDLSYPGMLVRVVE